LLTVEREKVGSARITRTFTPDLNLQQPVLEYVKISVFGAYFGKE
jgi:hypothetical protein